MLADDRAQIRKKVKLNVNQKVGYKSVCWPGRYLPLCLSPESHRITWDNTWAPAVTLSSSWQKPISVWGSANPDAIWWGQDFWEQAWLNNFRLSNYRFDVWEIYYCWVLPHFPSSFLSAIFDMPNGCLQHPLCGTGGRKEEKKYPLPCFFHLHFICQTQAFRIVTCQNLIWRDQCKRNAWNELLQNCKFTYIRSIWLDFQCMITQWIVRVF